MINRQEVMDFARVVNKTGIYSLTCDLISVFSIRDLRIENTLMNLKPQDILVLLKLIALGRESWSFGSLAVEVQMSPSEVHAAIKRALAAKLAWQMESRISPNIRNLEEFLLHGIQYVFVPERGSSCRGMPTAHAAPPLNSSIQPGQDLPPVWPDPEGEARGESFSPLYQSAVAASRKDARLYELLALVDAIRGGRAREKELAKMELKRRLDNYEQSTISRPGNI